METIFYSDYRERIVVTMTRCKGFIVLFCFCCLTYGVFNDVYIYSGQRVKNDQQIDVGGLQERINALNAQVIRNDDQISQLMAQQQALALSTAERLTKLETLAEQNTYLIRGVVSAVLLLVIKAYIDWKQDKLALFKMKKSEEGSGDLI